MLRRQPPHLLPADRPPDDPVAHPGYDPGAEMDAWWYRSDLPMNDVPWSDMVSAVLL